MCKACTQLIGFSWSKAYLKKNFLSYLVILVCFFLFLFFFVCLFVCQSNAKLQLLYMARLIVQNHYLQSTCHLVTCYPTASSVMQLLPSLIPCQYVIFSNQCQYYTMARLYTRMQEAFQRMVGLCTYQRAKWATKF